MVGDTYLFPPERLKQRRRLPTGLLGVEGREGEGLIHGMNAGVGFPGPYGSPCGRDP